MTTAGRTEPPTHSIQRHRPAPAPPAETMVQLPATMAARYLNKLKRDIESTRNDLDRLTKEANLLAPMKQKLDADLAEKQQEGAELLRQYEDVRAQSEDIQEEREKFVSDHVDPLTERFRNAGANLKQLMDEYFELTGSVWPYPAVVRDEFDVHTPRSTGRTSSGDNALASTSRHRVRPPPAAVSMSAESSRRHAPSARSMSMMPSTSRSNSNIASLLLEERNTDGSSGGRHLDEEQREDVSDDLAAAEPVAADVAVPEESFPALVSALLSFVRQCLPFYGL